MEISCSICHEEYTSNADISTTQCGHVFHTSCIQGWLNRSHTCPECRQKCIPTIKIYLKPEVSQTTLALKTQFDQCLKHSTLLQNLLDKSEQNVLNLHGLIQIMQSNIESLQDQNEHLAKEIDTKTKHLIKVTSEFGKKRDKFKQKIEEDKANFAQEMAVKYKIIESLKDVLGEKSIQLEEEIRISKSYAHHIKKLENLLKSNYVKYPKIQTPHYEEIDSKENPAFVLESADTAFRIENITKHSIRIKGFTEIKSPLKDVVLCLAKQMDIICNKEDIDNVYILPQRNSTFNKNSMINISLIVNFKTNDLKEKFLANEISLNENPTNQLLKIIDYKPSTTIDEIFLYAKKLEMIGFKHCFVYKGSVFVKENDITPSTKIYGKQQVDEMLKQNSKNPAA